MNKITDTFELRNGYKIPCVGFGTWQTPDGSTAVSAVKTAVSCGYRHIDAAAVYANEKSVGQGIAESTAKREDLFITSKVEVDSYKKHIHVVNFLNKWMCFCMSLIGPVRSNRFYGWFLLF